VNFSDVCRKNQTLFALAILTVSGASFAQSTVTLGGTYNFGFQKADNGATKADFFDAKVNFSGAEDLGGGLKASFSTEMQLGGRANLAPTTVDTKSSNVWARNATVSLAGGFGTLTGGRVESSNLFQSAQLAGASLSDGFDKAGLAGAVSNYNTVGYTTPAFNGFTASLSQAKLLNNDFAPAAGTANAELKVTSVGLSYANGPLVAGYVNKNVDTAGTASDGKKNELFATYDLGVAKVGLGYGKNSGARYAGEKATVIASAVVPVSANFTLGADYAKRSAGGTSATVDGKGYAVAANYMLSKRTKINATVGKLEGTSLVGQSQYRVGLFHTF
jgi:Gram-negative porin